MRKRDALTTTIILTLLAQPCLASDFGNWPEALFLYFGGFALAISTVAALFMDARVTRQERTVTFSKLTTSALMATFLAVLSSFVLVAEVEEPRAAVLTLQGVIAVIVTCSYINLYAEPKPEPEQEAPCKD